MSASPAVMHAGGDHRISSGRAEDEQIHIPANWRFGQIIVTVLIAGVCVYYNLRGWKSPGGETGMPDSRTLMDQVGFVLLAALVWLTTPTAGVIATTTFQEALRRRWMTAMLAFGLIMLALSTFFTWMQPGTEEKFLRDFGIGFIIIITLLMAIFLGVALVPPEIERRTIFTILSKPVNRIEFLIGKFLGLCLTLFVNLVLMALMFVITYALFRFRKEGYAGAMQVDIAAQHPGLGFDVLNISKALFLQFGQLTIMSALALTLSLLVTNITAIVFCFLAYFGGQMSSYWEHLGQNSEEGPAGAGLSASMQNLIKTVYIMLPRLDRFDVRERLINDMPIGFNYIWKAMGSGTIYVAALLTIAYLVFSDREF